MSTLVMKTKNYFSDWTLFEISWLIISTLTMLTLSIVWGDSPMALISGITGIISVVLCAKGKISTYAFACVNVGLYAIIAYQNRLFGEVMLNGFYYLPMNIVGFYMWRKQKDDEGTVIARRLTAKQIILLVIGLLIAITAYWRVLVALGGNLQLIDSITTVLSIVAFLLQIGRFMEQWILWMIINVFSITMWSLLLGTPEGSVTMIIMFSAYLINGVYGFRNWLKLSNVN
ncbi:MAG: nicotinamide riboside transporter PnuC [Turicibacter sp.]|nr:nicotinamide riboside transporter PnuC [Turicibacter sp.]